MNKMVISVICFVDFRCKSPPVVYNATVSLDQTTRLLTVTCIPGHRLSDGLTEDVFQCEADGSWNNRYHCQGAHLTISLPHVVIIARNCA